MQTRHSISTYIHYIVEQASTRRLQSDFAGSEAIEQNRSYIDMVPEVFGFVQNLILPSIADGNADDRITFQLQPSRNYNAGVRCCRGGKFEIYVNEGIVDRLYAFCNIYGGLDSLFMREHLTAFEQHGVSYDQALGVSFTAGLIQVLMHEYFHVAAGHVGYLKETYWQDAEAEFCFSESDEYEDDPVYQAFRKMTELEADGAAAALTLQFSEDILEGLNISFASGEARPDLLHRAVLLGCFGAVCLINGLFEKSVHANEEYPFPATRLINLCSSYFRVVAPDVVSWKDGDFKVRNVDDNDASDITDLMQSSVSRALFILHDALEVHGTKSELLVEGWIDRPNETTEFMYDILMVLGGSTPFKSVHGRELSELSELRANMMHKLVPHRELDLWPMTESG